MSSVSSNKVLLASVKILLFFVGSCDAILTISTNESKRKQLMTYKIKRV